MRTKLLLIFMALLLQTSAYGFTINNLEYVINSDGKSVTLSKAGSITGNLIIPASVSYALHSYSVTEIGRGAFWSCNGLTSVTIPYSVTKIDDEAFENCKYMTSVIIEDPNPVSGGVSSQLESIGQSAFYNCKKLTSVNIPKSVTSIGANAFSYTDKLNSVIITDLAAWCNISFGNLWANPLYSANNLYLNGSLVSNLVIPSTVTKISPVAFCGCTCLKSVSFHSSVKSIGRYAFNGCIGLTSVVIPRSVYTIGAYAFSNCSGLTSMVVESGNSKYDSRDNCNAIIETETNKLLLGCQNTTILNSITSIECGAFEGCKGMTSVTIPGSVESIGVNAFRKCSGLTSIIVENGNSKYDSRGSCNAIIETETNKLLFGCQNTTIPNSVTSIESDAFNGCTSLTSMNIPNSVTSIGENAFYDCKGLISVKIPYSVKSIGYYAFGGCTSLTSIKCRIYTPLVLDDYDNFDYVFTGVDKNNCILYVPKGRTIIYHNCPIWSSFVNIEEIPYVAGDVNDDEEATVVDITCLYNFLLNGDEIDIVNGDQNEDGEITANDVTFIFNILLGDDQK